MKPLSLWQKDRMKQVSKQLIANIVVIVLVCYVIIAVEQIRTTNCNSDSVLSPLNISLASFANQPQQPPQTQPQPQSQPETPSQPLPETPLRSAAHARHGRPLPECARSDKPARTFLMVFMGHSGSSALLSELSAHSKVYVEIPELVDHQEVFNTTAALQTTREFFDRGIAKGMIPGYKIRPVHIMNEPEEWRKLVDEYDTRIIWQYRKNFFKAAIGEYKLRFLNDTTVIEGLRSNMSLAKRCEVGTCSFPIKDFDYLHTLVKEVWRSQRNIVSGVKIVARDGCIREAPYEDYLHDRLSTLKDVFRFLGIQFEETQPSRFKATSDNLCDVVENWEEVCQKFYVCPTVAHLLEDEHNQCFCPAVSGSTELCEI